VTDLVEERVRRNQRQSTEHDVKQRYEPEDRL
jgi:hypothetical protein